jgi:hypothetical protein
VWGCCLKRLIFVKKKTFAKSYYIVFFLKKNGKKNFFFSKKTKDKQLLTLVAEVELATRAEFLSSGAFDEKVALAAVTSLFDGLSASEFKTALSAASARHRLTREGIRARLEKGGKSSYEAVVLYEACAVSLLYDAYYIDWLAAMEGGVDDTMGHHTFDGVSYGVFFEAHCSAIAGALETMVRRVRPLCRNDGHHMQVRFLEAYAMALRERRVEVLEERWSEVDGLYAQVRGVEVEIVHDLEWGYGPIASKAIPDFSVRLVDGSFEVSGPIRHFSALLAGLAAEHPRCEALSAGLEALSKCQAVVVSVPFQTGQSFCFRFQGQATPDRPEVRARHGVKLFFDPAVGAMRAREALARNKRFVWDAVVEEEEEVVCTDAFLREWVIAHEVGHCFLAVPGGDPRLEEPRAELAAANYLASLGDDELGFRILRAWAVLESRRDVDADAENPVTVAYKRSAQIIMKSLTRDGFLTGVHDKIGFDRAATRRALGSLSAMFMELVHAQIESPGEHWAVARLLDRWKDY